MRRLPALLSLVAVALLGLLAAGRLGLGTGAQEGTPPPGEEEFEVPEGVGFAALAFAPVAELPATPAEFILFRFTLDPGASFAFGEDEPGLALAHVESGTFTVAMQGPMTVLRAPGAGTPFPEQADGFAPGVEFTLGPGDSALFPPNVAGELRNDGAEPAVALVAEIAPAEGGEGEGTPGAATPAA